MKNIVLTLTFILTTILSGYGQVINAVNWNYESKVIDNETFLISTATIKEGYHFSSQFLEGEGPIATEINFTPNSNYKLIGKSKELSKSYTEYDDILK